MSVVRTVLAAGLATVAVASGIVAPAGAAPRTPAALQADAWADFQAPNDGVDQADTLHWYGLSPVVTKAMVGRSLRYMVTSPATIDCNSLAAGWATRTAWRNAPFTTRSCNATRAVASITVTRAMVGSRVTLLGWTATSATTGSVRVQVTAPGLRTQTVAVRASRTDAPVPVGPLTTLGTVGRTTVSLASKDGANEVWVGRSTRYVVPAGEVVHSDLTSGVVHLLVQTGPATMSTFVLDVATGRAVDKAVVVEGRVQSMALKEANGHGFIVDTDIDRIAYNWDGVARVGVGFRRDRLVGLAGDYAGWYGFGQVPSVAFFTRLSDGHQISSDSRGMMLGGAALNRDAVSMTFRAQPTIDVVLFCTFTLTGTTCVQRQG